MDGRGFWKLGGVSDTALEGQLRQLIAAGVRTEAYVVAHLAEVETRRLHLLEGYPSLFDYCKKRLGLSENEAFHRIVAARMARQFPAIFELLHRRELFITTLPLLRDYITCDNHAELLHAVRGRSRTQVLEVLAARAPRPEARSHIRKLPITPRSVAAGPTGTLEPLSPLSYRLQLNTSHALKEKLELARDLMSHANPSGDVAVVVERALDLLITSLQKRRFGQTSRPTHFERSKSPPSNDHDSATSDDKPRGVVAPNGNPNTRAIAPNGNPDTAEEPTNDQPANANPNSSANIPPNSNANANPNSSANIPPNSNAPHRSPHRPHTPSSVRRQVVARDGLQCTFVSSSGQRCDARTFLQIDHQHPWARGGAENLENLRLLCAHHNRLRAEQDFGTAHVHAKIQHARKRAG